MGTMATVEARRVRVTPAQGGGENVARVYGVSLAACAREVESLVNGLSGYAARVEASGGPTAVDAALLRAAYSRMERVTDFVLANGIARMLGGRNHGG